MVAPLVARAPSPAASVTEFASELVVPASLAASTSTNASKACASEADPPAASAASCHRWSDARAAAASPPLPARGKGRTHER